MLLLNFLKFEKILLLKLQFLVKKFFFWPRLFAIVFVVKVGELLIIVLAVLKLINIISPVYLEIKPFVNFFLTIDQVNIDFLKLFIFFHLHFEWPGLLFVEYSFERAFYGRHSLCSLRGVFKCNTKHLVKIRLSTLRRGSEILLIPVLLLVQFL